MTHLRSRFGGAAAGFWLSTKNRIAFSTMYERLRSSAFAIASNSAYRTGSMRLAIGIFFSDCGKGFRGMTGRVDKIIDIGISKHCMRC